MAFALQSQSPRTAVQRAADMLREEILDAADGALLGSEDELLSRLGISRPTLRQTARLLEHEQLLSVRRGVKGGYYARNPDVGAVAHVAAYFLEMRHTTFGESFSASQSLLEEALRRAATSQDETVRAKFEKTIASFSPVGTDLSASQLLREDVEFIQIVLELADNPAIELLTRILYEFGLRQSSARIFHDRPDRIREWHEGRARVAAAISESDPELVLLLARRRRDAMSGWIEEDLGNDQIGAARRADSNATLDHLRRPRQAS
jgi:GntR family transcriptional regulator, transcriptional repressor for pyruvate dehydrogenase complex